MIYFYPIDALPRYFYIKAGPRRSRCTKKGCYISGRCGVSLVAWLEDLA